jgi:hypothetical protein
MADQPLPDGRLCEQKTRLVSRKQSRDRQGAVGDLPIGRDFSITIRTDPGRAADAAALVSDPDEAPAPVPLRVPAPGSPPRFGTRHEPARGSAPSGSPRTRSSRCSVDTCRRHGCRTCPSYSARRCGSIPLRRYCIRKPFGVYFFLPDCRGGACVTRPRQRCASLSITANSCSRWAARFTRYRSKRSSFAPFSAARPASAWASTGL